MSRVAKLSKETTFRDAIQQFVQNRPAVVYSLSSNDKYNLDLTRSSNGYKNIANYYYHIRCNIVHGGKVMFQIVSL